MWDGGKQVSGGRLEQVEKHFRCGKDVSWRVKGKIGCGERQWQKVTVGKAGGVRAKDVEVFFGSDEAG